MRHINTKFYAQKPTEIRDLYKNRNRILFKEFIKNNIKEEKQNDND